MTKKEINIAIAEFRGYERILGDPWQSTGIEAWFPLNWTVEMFIKYGEPALYVEDLPNYCEDLNAINEVEQYLWSKDWPSSDDFVDNLYDIMGFKHCLDRTLVLLNATAHQRAEALLMTIEQLKEEKPTDQKMHSKSKKKLKKEVQ